jgi:hypothetical protein
MDIKILDDNKMKKIKAPSWIPVDNTFFEACSEKINQILTQLKINRLQNIK